MKKIALVFVLAVLVPSLVLAWLAVRSLRDQQFLLERQQALLYQRVTDAAVAQIGSWLAEQQRQFSAQVEKLANGKNAAERAPQFDEALCAQWPLAEVGFCVTLTGNILSPRPGARPVAQMFRLDNSRFLGNREPVEVYWNANGKGATQNSTQFANQAFSLNSQQNNLPAENRVVAPQSQNYLAASPSQIVAMENVSKVVPAAADFRQLMGDASDGMLARFLQNKLKLVFWHRLEGDPQLIFGAQLNLDRVIASLREFIQPEAALRNEVCVALLDDNAKPLALSRTGFRANWKQPFVASEIGEALPHWEVAVYLLNPAQLTEAVRTAKLTLGLLVAVLVLAIGVGSWLIGANLNSELRLARQKTDFVSNVSHELKTPLTSIRMFSELLAEGRVSDPAKQRSYLQIISAEASRLSRLINNVLDFSHLQSGEKKYNLQMCDLTEVARAAGETFRPHLESGGFHFECKFPPGAIFVHGDADALSQVLVNLLSNAEKYSDARKEILLTVTRLETPTAAVDVRVLDRGSEIPRGSEQAVFEKFYRAHDSLSSGIQGSGLGLTIARQIARAHGGDVFYEPRAGGGSIFSLRLPRTDQPA
jgi:signal transduction histidine kinase